eukprot:SAG31_NODE_2356_length_5874_cov_17.280000_4_plen_211_part_00
MPDAKPKPRQKLWYTSCCPSCITDRIFYGWIILVVCTVGKIMSSPGQSPCLGPTTDAIATSLGMSESFITGLYFVGTLCSAFSLPQMGKVLDRVRPRKFIVGVSLCLSGACFFLSVTQNAFMLLVAFFMLRFFGQGSMMMASQTPINYWYVTNRGSRMGIAGAATSLFMMGKECYFLVFVGLFPLNLPYTHREIDRSLSRFHGTNREIRD